MFQILLAVMLRASSFTLLFSTAFVLVAPFAFAQQNMAIKGEVLSSSNVPVPYATAILYYGATDSVISTSFTDSAGTIDLPVAHYGEYEIAIEAMGFTTYHSPSIAISKEVPVVNLSAINLVEASEQLGNVTISGRKPLVEHHLDKMVLNVENSILAEGNTALEVLAKAPGILVDDNGSIMLRGKQGVTVMINGKLTYLSQKDLANFLKSTPSSSIKSIEVIANPSAKYDAAGNAGIINIRLKKNSIEGLNGNAYANYGQGRKERYGAGINLNYRNKAWNVYGSYDHAFRGEKEYVSINRNFYNSGIAESTPDYISYQQSVTDEPLRTNNFKAGVDYNIGEHTVIGALVSGKSGTYENRSTGSNNVLSFPDNTPRSLADTRNGNKEHWLNMSYNLNFTHQFKNGAELSADADYSRATFEALQSLEAIYNETASMPSSISLRRVYIPSTTEVYVGKVDYTLPIGKNIHVETGWKSSFVTSDNNARYDTATATGWANDAGTTNHFIYKEQIHAGYINYKHQLGSTQLQAGLRAEMTATTAHQLTTDSLVKRSYLQWFPSVALKQNLDAQHALQISYNKRIDRPDYFDLNPFRFYVDPFLFMQGNPYLQPQISHNGELAYSWQSRFSAALFFTQTNNVLTDVLQQIDDQNITIRSTQNLNSQRSYGANISGTFQPVKWWSSANFATLYMNGFKGTYLGHDIDNRRLTYILNAQNTITLGWNMSAEVSARYVSGTAYGVFKRDAYFDLSAGVQKRIFDGKGTIKAAITDIFRTNNYYVNSIHRNINLSQQNRLDSRVLTVSFSYRFKAGDDAQNRRSAGSEDIQNRLKG